MKKGPLGQETSGPAIRGLRKRLLTWYDKNKRDLPWRHTSDPYSVLVSEIMLQQTRVDTVIPYYQNFLQRFPDAQSLAEADTERVLESWSGLGYYSRARNLQNAARQVLSDHGGEFPQSSEALKTLPGIGPYTAGAVASIAFDRPEPIVDGNVARVFCRLFGIRKDFRSASANARLWELAAAFARGVRPGDLNQGLMELGALLCTPKSPDCPSCPLRTSCDAFRVGDAESLPIKAKKQPSPKISAVGILALKDDRALFVQRGERELLGGMWELPGGPLKKGESKAAGAKRVLRETLGLELTGARHLGEVHHVFSHRELFLQVVTGTASGRVQRQGFEAHAWRSPTSLAKRAPNALTKKALALALHGRKSKAKTARKP